MQTYIHTYRKNTKRDKTSAALPSGPKLKNQHTYIHTHTHTNTEKRPKGPKFQSIELHHQSASTSKPRRRQGHGPHISHTYIHAYIHTYTHTHTQTHKQTHIQKKDKKDPNSKEFSYITKRLDTNPGVDKVMVLTSLRNQAVVGTAAYFALTSLFKAPGLPFDIDPTFFDLFYAATAAVPLVVGSWFMSRSKNKRMYL
jgi:hypothetical protein